MVLPRAARTQRRTRIQEEKEEQILEAALEVFSANGFRGSTIDQIADVPPAVLAALRKADQCT